MTGKFDWIEELRGKKQTLKERSDILHAIRSWFFSNHFIEVHTPRLAKSPGLEPNLEPFATTVIPPRNEKEPYTAYLPTSPEFYMKKLLAAGFEKIYDLGTCFRNAEGSELHEPEFLMLEWYRAGGTDIDIMNDCEALITSAAAAIDKSSITVNGNKVNLLDTPWDRISCSELFESVGIDLSEAVDEFLAGNEFGLAHRCRKAGFDYINEDDQFDTAFFKLFLTEFEPKLGIERPAFLTGYPANMSAYAVLDENDPRFARRFELYIGGIELANAFFEVVDLDEQLRREIKYIEERKALGKEPVPQDEEFHQALEHGMPQSAGIAMGIDRLVMLLLEKNSIQEVLPFYTWTRED